LGSLPQTAELIFLGSPNNWSISSELIPGCIFITFAVVKDEGKADIIEVISVGMVPHEASNKAMSKVGSIRISIVPLFFLTKVTYGTNVKITEVEIGDDWLAMPTYGHTPQVKLMEMQVSRGFHGDFLGSCGARRQLRFLKKASKAFKYLQIYDISDSPAGQEDLHGLQFGLQ